MTSATGSLAGKTAAARLPFLLSRPTSLEPIRTAFKHRLGQAELTFVPSREPPSEGQRRQVFLFLPGNPGLVRYYDTFFATLSAPSSALPPTVDLLAIGHIGHGPSLPPPADLEALDLEAQVAAKVELLDDLWSVLGDHAEIVVGGHSVGCWMAVELLKRRPRIRSLALLFPTLSHIADTPNGRALWPIFRPLSIPLIGFSSYLFRLAPTRLLNLLVPPTTVSLVRSSHVIKSALILGRSEMSTILDADLAFLGAERHRIWAYYGKNDGWVDDKEARKITDVLEAENEGPSADEGAIQKVWHCVESIPHAFCLLHGDVMGTKVAGFLRHAFSQ